MSQDSQEIKTVEQWRWSEMQGLELVSTSPPSLDHFITNTTTPNRETNARENNQEEEKGGGGGVERRSEMESSSSETKKDGGGGSNGEKASAVSGVGFGELFRFADSLDYVLMGIGSVGAFVHGCSLPLFLRFFADLVNSFGSNANDMDKMMQEVLKVK